MSASLERVAVIGAHGQLGRALCRQLGEAAVPFGRNDVDITQPATIETALQETQPTAVINAAAYNLVDRAEAEPAAAYTTNALGPRNLALFCEQHQVPLVHVSSDYVFGQEHLQDNREPRSRRPFTEDDLPAPQSAYAVSKLTGEYYVRSLCPRSFVLRTCGLYGPMPTPGRGNFVETMLRLGAERDELTVVNDQTCAPTAVEELATAIRKCLETTEYGLYHATNGGETTWCEFARQIMSLSGLGTAVTPLTTEEFGAAAPRPAYSVLNCDRLAHRIGFRFRSLTTALADYLLQRGV